MRTKKNKILLIILFVLIYINVSAQYLDKRNQVSFDFFSPFSLGEYGGDYKLTVSKHVALSASYSLFNQKGNIDGSYSLFHLPFQTPGTSGDGVYQIGGNSWGLSLLLSNKQSMPMPLGYYLGFGYKRYNCNIKENIFSEINHPVIENNNNISYLDDGKYEYENKGSQISFIWGKETCIFNNVVLDIQLTFGLKFGSLVGKNAASYTRSPSCYYPSNGLDFNLFLLNNALIDNGDMTKQKYRYFDGFFAPLIKIGYLF